EKRPAVASSEMIRMPSGIYKKCKQLESSFYSFFPAWRQTTCRVRLFEPSDISARIRGCLWGHREARSCHDRPRRRESAMGKGGTILEKESINSKGIQRRPLLTSTVGIV